MLKQSISQERWEQAQEGEKLHHNNQDLNYLYNHYGAAYEYYFKYLNIDKDLNGKSIIEIGPAKFASLLYCTNYEKSYIVEPSIYDDVKGYYENKNLVFIHDLYESCDSPTVDEIWLFNLMQHVKNPDALIEKAKAHSKIIRFFEPIDLPTNLEHPFSFSEDDYKQYFGDCVKIYTSIGERPFHEAKCAYGVYHCK